MYLLDPNAYFRFLMHLLLHQSSNNARRDDSPSDHFLFPDLFPLYIVPIWAAAMRTSGVLAGIDLRSTIITSNDSIRGFTVCMISSGVCKIPVLALLRVLVLISPFASSIILMSSRTISISGFLVLFPVHHSDDDKDYNDRQHIILHPGYACKSQYDQYEY